MEDKSIEIILFEQIQLALATLISSKVIRTVEIYNAQIDSEDKERPRLYPYVSVEINTEWQNDEAVNSVPNLLQNQQKGNCTINIRYTYDSLKTETNSWLEHKGNSHLVHRALNGLEYSNDAAMFTSLIRTSTPHPVPFDQVGEIVTTYSTTVIECGITDDTQIELESGTWIIQHNNKLIVDNVIIRSGKLESVGRVFHVNDFPPADYIPQPNDVIVQ